MLSFKTTGYTTAIGGLHLKPAFTKRKISQQTITESEFSQHTEKGPVSETDVLQTPMMKTTQRKRHIPSKKRSVPAKKAKKVHQSKGRKTKPVIKHKKKNKTQQQRRVNKDRF